MALALIRALSTEESKTSEQMISVNPVVAEVATWYEKLRNAMAYKEDEVILRNAIERILNRRLLLGGKGSTIASPLVRELVWARYFPDGSVPETLVSQIEQCIDLYLKLQTQVIEKHNLNRSIIFEWILQLMSSEIESILAIKKDKEVLSNFMFQIFKDRISIEDDSVETKDVQVFIAIRRAFAKEDIALLRFHLFLQIFGSLNSTNFDQVSEMLPKAIRYIDKQIQYRLRDKIYTYIKNQAAPFFILEDLIKNHRENVSEIFDDPQTFDALVLEACSNRYKDISNKVSRAIIRSVIFIFVTKVIFALALESTFESFIYGAVSWFSISINILISPLLMVIASIFIKTPDRENSTKILSLVQTILFEQTPALSRKLNLVLNPKNSRPILRVSFTLLWILALGLGIWGINLVLGVLKFNLVSKGVFIFFLMIVSFLSYRINQTAKIYLVKEEEQNILSILFDFFFMPFIQLGKNLTLGISQINVILFIFDFVIETPFKSIFAFFEHWFLYLKTQRETID